VLATSEAERGRSLGRPARRSSDSVGGLKLDLRLIIVTGGSNTVSLTAASLGTFLECQGVPDSIAGLENSIDEHTWGAMAAVKQLSLAETNFIDPRGLNPDFDPNGILEQITCSALHVTGANGAALALSDGKIMSCRACCGYSAPPVGALLITDTGLTATCVKTARLLRCDDTEADPWVDRSKCIQLGIRSILAVPVFDAQGVAGVLEVLSNEPKKFTDRHAFALQLLARLVETVVNYSSTGDGPFHTLTHDAQFPGHDSGTVNTDETSVACLSCGHSNPQGSQSCNRCGTILNISPGSLEPTADFSLPDDTDSSADEGLTKIYRLICGSAGPTTWNDISARLLANLQSPSVQDKPYMATTEKVTTTSAPTPERSATPKPAIVLRRLAQKR
jgi:GAF domain